MLTFDDCVALSNAETHDIELLRLDTITAFRVMAKLPLAEISHATSTPHFHPGVIKRNPQQE